MKDSTKKRNAKGLEREQKLARALRDNLRKRKHQARARSAPDSGTPKGTKEPPGDL